MLWNIVRVLVVSLVVVTVGEISKRYPRAGALLLSLPLVSILAFLVAWFQHRDLPSISKLSRETLVLVPLSLPFFVPMAFAPRIGIGFWTALSTGIVLTSLTLGAWLVVNPHR